MDKRGGGGFEMSPPPPLHPQEVGCDLHRKWATICLSVPESVVGSEVSG